MSRVLCVGSHGANQPAKASFPFAAALIATNAGDEAQVALVSDATRLMKDAVLRKVHTSEWPALAELLQRVVDLGIPVFVCEGCCRVQGVSGNDVASKQALLATPEQIMEMKTIADKVLRL